MATIPGHVGDLYARRRVVRLHPGRGAVGAADGRGDLNAPGGSERLHCHRGRSASAHLRPGAFEQPAGNRGRIPIQAERVEYLVLADAYVLLDTHAGPQGASRVVGTHRFASWHDAARTLRTAGPHELLRPLRAEAAVTPGGSAQATALADDATAVYWDLSDPDP